MPTDRGYVTVTELAEGYTVQVSGLPANGDCRPNAFAIHTGVPEIEVEAQAGLVRAQNCRYSVEPLEVFVAEDDGKLYIADIRNGQA
ncbi:hypothetical protein H0B56_12970 [Haloechinothrix sp. YIM 98757]|uniref:Uncharacterized protein n=1 Tax=Haloechinothrix aidingensis TaxID=2752311 RepID=A0A838AB69_9PSEU|nr:hypothetical protein [Haloechinothrix aidingensis]MBA0126455.1 hypothetical protein [Haloechinothrix aidingensis]